MKARSEPASKSRSKRSSLPAHSSNQYDPAADCPREQMIAEAAYFHAERRGFTPGNELSDWLQAEADVERISGRSH